MRSTTNDLLPMYKDTRTRKGRLSEQAEKGVSLTRVRSNVCKSEIAAGTLLDSSRICRMRSGDPMLRRRPSAQRQFLARLTEILGSD